MSTRSGSANERALTPDLASNLEAIKSEFSGAPDLSVRELLIGKREPKRAAVIFLKSMVSLETVMRSVVQALTVESSDLIPDDSRSHDFLELVSLRLPAASEVHRLHSFDEVVDSILRGETALLVDGTGDAISIEAADPPARNPQVPISEATILGPQLGFTESLATNVAMIRTRLRSSNLTIERLVIGRQSRTEVRLLYVKNVAPKEIVAELRRRLNQIDTDMILDVGMIRDLITERPNSPFVMARLTERPDTVASELNHGWTVILVDGSPFAMLQPSQFFTLIETSEDYYMQPILATVLRLLRLVAYVFSSIASPLYVAVVNYHHELVPLPLLLNIAATQEGVPFPLPVTAFGTEIVLDIVREAGVRLPQQFGPAVSIVGALVLGQSAIQAGFVPPGLIIVVMFATIASFAVPRAEKALAYRLIRFPLLLLASVLGLPGLMLGVLAVMYHVASLKILGVPYFQLYTPGNVPRLARKLILAPAKLRPKTRPLGHNNRFSRGPLPKPKDPKDNARDGDAK